MPKWRILALQRGLGFRVKVLSRSFWHFQKCPNDPGPKAPSQTTWLRTTKWTTKWLRTKWLGISFIIYLSMLVTFPELSMLKLKLYHACVLSILMYCSPVWFANVACMRWLNGKHSYASNLSTLRQLPVWYMLIVNDNLLPMESHTRQTGHNTSGRFHIRRFSYLHDPLWCLCSV